MTGGVARRLSVSVWYPAQAPKQPTAGQPALDPSWRALRASALEKRIGSPAARMLAALRVHAIPDAALAPGNHLFPVLLFSPGLNWLATEYSAILEDLASYGYVVVGFTPTGFVEPVRFRDGTVVSQNYGPGDQPIWDADFRFVLGEVLSLNREGFLQGRLDTSRVGAFGHSMGGASAIVVAAIDARVKAAANIDGDFMGTATGARPTQPIMLISNEESLEGTGILERIGRQRSEARRSQDWVHVAEKATSSVRVKVKGSRHWDFGDVAMLPPDSMEPKHRASRFGGIDGTVCQQLTVDVLRAFFETALQGKPGEIDTVSKKHTERLTVVHRTGR